jgi:hypothetical protein
MDDVGYPGRGLIGLLRRLVDRLTAAKTHLAVLRRRLRRGEVAPAEVEAHLAQVEQQLDEAAAATENITRAVESPVSG